MTPHYEDDAVTLHHGDCLDVMRTLPDASVDAIVTDPPYGLGFMGREWDDLPPGLPWARECLRVLKPGGHLLAFGGSRTWHRLAVAVEDAGFEMRDSIAWLYGSGFPKSLDVSKAIDKTPRAEERPIALLSTVIGQARRAAGLSLREVGERVLEASDGEFGEWYHRGGTMFWERGKVPGRREWAALCEVLPELRRYDELHASIYEPAEAWRTAPVVRTERRSNEASGLVAVGQGARQTVEREVRAANSEAARAWQGWGTALKPAFEPVVVGRKSLVGTVAGNVLAHGTGALNIDACRTGTDGGTSGAGVGPQGDVYGDGLNGAFGKPVPGLGRWPTNVALDDCQAAELDRQSGVLHSQDPATRLSRSQRQGVTEMGTGTSVEYADSGGASRFFPTFRYEAKAPTDERPRDGDVAHPTVKPLDLMRWLVRLVTPPVGTVLEPFAGSGTTAEACVIEGFRCIAIEREAAYLPLIVARLSKPIQPDLFGGAA